MDHTYIEEHQIAERYVAGALTAEESERFEDHYLSCPECLDRLELAESLRRGFRRMAEQDAAGLSAARQLALVAWLARLGRRRQLGVLFAVFLLLAVLPSGLVLRGIAGRDRELAATRSALATERQRAVAGTESAAEADRLRSQLAASRHELEGERAARAQAAEQLAQALQPQGNVPTLDLDVERDAGPRGGAPTSQLRLPATGSILLTRPLDPPFLPSYRAILKDAQGREILRVADLHPNEHDTLTLSLPVRLVPPGDYSLVIEGLKAGSKPAAAGRFTFRLLPPA